MAYRISYTYALFMIAALLAASCSGGSTGKRNSTSTPDSPGDTASIVFRKYEHDFGRIVEGEKVSCTFVFENRGTKPLVINSATASCGCTVPRYDSKPVEQGATGTIEIVFDSSGRQGKQTKTVTVASNATKPVVLLRITGEIVSGNIN